jgi:hypothetical protein
MLTASNPRTVKPSSAQRWHAQTAQGGMAALARVISIPTESAVDTHPYARVMTAAATNTGWTAPPSGAQRLIAQTTQGHSAMTQGHSAALGNVISRPMECAVVSHPNARVTTPASRLDARKEVVSYYVDHKAIINQEQDGGNGEQIVRVLGKSAYELKYMRISLV